MSELIAATVQWLASTGAPNWLVILALLTHPSVWSDRAINQLQPLFNRTFPRSNGS